jgi:hypothetical protein
MTQVDNSLRVIGRSSYFVLRLKEDIQGFKPMYDAA